MNGKVCLVTGANAGLGKATATGLARAGAYVILACRDRGRGEAALAEIIAATGNPTIELLLVDLSDQASIRAAVANFFAIHDRLDVLVNNAAVFKQSRALTRDGLEAMFATNHLGPFLLTNLLLPALQAGAPARVLNITAPSTTHLDFDDLQGERRFRPLTAFGASKMCNLLFTYELTRRLEGTGVTVNAVHPGLVKSSLLTEAPRVLGWLSNLFAKTPEQAAATPVYLASSPDVAGMSGKFFKGKQAIASNAYSQDRDVQRRLWETSTELVHLA